jgi:hypothetical protein
MDPDANIRETIALLKQGAWSEQDVERLDELRQAYSEWRRNGGFPASLELLNELQSVLSEAAREPYLDTTGA